MVVSRNKRPQDGPQKYYSLYHKCPKKGPLIFGKLFIYLEGNAFNRFQGGLQRESYLQTHSKPRPTLKIQPRILDLNPEAPIPRLNPKPSILNPNPQTTCWRQPGVSALLLMQAPERVQAACLSCCVGP